MKPLFISPYYDGTGYSQAGIDLALAMDAVGIPVVCRSLKLNNEVSPPPSRLLELLGRDSSGCDTVIQHALPTHWDYDGRMWNIGFFAWETDGFAGSEWVDCCNRMDELWVPCQANALACEKSGVKTPVKVVPHANDVTRFQQSYGRLESLRPYKDGGEFLFYTIGEFHRRKNFAALLKAFYLEFDPDEPVRLVIKTGLPGLNPGELKEHVKQFADSIAAGLKVRQRKQEVIITERLSAPSLFSLHDSCDCFVLSSYGEAWCIPAMDALGMGKTPIVTACGGFLDYIDDSVGWLVDARQEPVFGMDGFADLYTGRENWSSVDVLDLRSKMRAAFSQEKNRKEKARRGLKRAYDYSYASVGKKLVELLSAVNPEGGPRVQTVSHEAGEGVLRSSRSRRDLAGVA